MLLWLLSFLISIILPLDKILSVFLFYISEHAKCKFSFVALMKKKNCYRLDCVKKHNIIGEVKE